MSIDFKEERAGWQESTVGYISCLLYSEEIGDLVEENNEYDICYVNLYDLLIPEYLPSRLFVFFEDLLWTESNKAWADWVLNRSPVATVFKTKTVEESIEFGIEVDCYCNYFMSKGALGVLRHGFEFGGWPWYRLVNEFGFTEDEAFALSCNVRLGRKTLGFTPYATEHKVFLGGQPYDTYLGKRFDPYEGGSFSEGTYHNYGVHSSWNTYVLGDLPSVYRGLDLNSPEKMKDNLKLALQNIKEF